MTEQPAEPSSLTTCNACGRGNPAVETTSYRLLRGGIADKLTGIAGHPFAPEAPICRTCVNDAQRAYVTARLTAERGELTALETEIARKAADHAAIATHIDDLFTRQTSRGQRVADAVARVGGSWGFVITFVSILVAWMLFNTWVLAGHAFDPYPYILLNLLLSCVAALQAPAVSGLPLSESRRCLGGECRFICALGRLDFSVSARSALADTFLRRRRFR
ncbi:MAG TPA: DUF1003 domain-containing protein [Polyangiales bacterium]|nr:DUF1003 domain-containing protein [Polyangiales bacterium]